MEVIGVVSWPSRWSSVEGMLLVCMLLIGMYIFLNAIYRNLLFIQTQLFRTPKDLRKRYGPDTWCVITGASEGIGLGFAVEFAKLGFNICLISRNIEKLKNAEKEVLQCNSNVKTRLIVADFSMGSELKFWDDLEQKLTDLEVSVLVNNVGMNCTERFEEISEQFLLDAMQVNCTSQVMMTRKLIGGMLKRNNHRSAIISVSSVVGMRPVLYLPSYCATKAFNDFFSRSLSLEFGDKIDILSLRAGYVVSNMSKLKEKGGFVLDRYECARGCMDKLGFVTETYGNPLHALYAKSYLALPEAILSERRKQRLLEKKQLD